MSTPRDYYEILGIQKGSSVDEIKKAYRSLVMKYHPDRVQESEKKAAEAKFKEISEAYAVLSDEQKRKLYDQYGHAGVDSRYSTEDLFRNADFSEFGGGEMFEDLLSQFGFSFGGGSRRSSGRRSAQRGEDIQVGVEITLDEANRGLEKDITFNHLEGCPSCRGTGAQDGAGKETCQACRGRGMVSSGMGFINFAQTCPSCGGEGQVVKQKCKSCGGQGRVKKSKNLKVTIPAGVDTGSVLRLRDEGNYGPGGIGDLYIQIQLRPHPLFRREGDDLHHKHTISFTRAILGGDINVPTLQGDVKMNIPAGTQPNSVFRLKGKGVMSLRTRHPGDQFVEVEVEIPKKLSGAERKLVEDLAKMRRE